MSFDDAEYIRNIVWDIDEIKLVLSGKNHIRYIFAWRRHPFGFEFWNREEIHFQSGLSEKARRELERIVIIMELL